MYIYDVSYPNVKLLSTIDGPAEFSKFGSSLAVGYPFGVMSGPVLAVGAPSLGKLAIYFFCFDFIQLDYSAS